MDTLVLENEFVSTWFYSRVASVLLIHIKTGYQSAFKHRLLKTVFLSGIQILSEGVYLR